LPGKGSGKTLPTGAIYSTGASTNADAPPLKRGQLKKASVVEWTVCSITWRHPKAPRAHRKVAWLHLAAAWDTQESHKIWATISELASRLPLRYWSGGLRTVGRACAMIGDACH